jgi:hypothetical protein
LSTRSAGTGGALAGVDPLTPLNPASILDFAVGTAYMQLAPEFRKVTANGVTDNTTTQRFPVFIGAMPFGDRLMIAISSSTLLDRTWQTTQPASQVIGTDTVNFKSSTTSDGAVNDIRLAAGYAWTSWLRVGLGLHAMSGRDLVTVRRIFEDTLLYGNTTEPRTTNYTGNALSVGAEIFQRDLGFITFEARRGGKLTQSAGDTVIASGHIPDHFGASVAFTGISGTTIAARTALDKWGSLGSFDALSGAAHDSWDSGVGAEVAGPRLGGISSVWRVGGRWRDLPFPADGARVREGSLSAGLGILLAQGHAALDLGAIRASRTAGAGISESAWTLSIGLTVRP